MVIKFSLLFFFVFLKRENIQVRRKHNKTVQTTPQTTMQILSYQILTSTSTNIGGYRYFFNGQEADNEIFGGTSFCNYGFRMYDARIARFWSVDPITKNFPMLSPFQFASNTPIWAIDMDGLEAAVRPARNANTRPVFFRENNNYARTENYGRLPSTRTVRTNTYSYATKNGAISIVSSPSVSYIYDYHSPQGNNVFMSNNNIQAQTLALLGDMCQFFVNKIEDRINTPQGFRTNSNTKITFVKIQDQLMFDQLQRAYDVLFDKMIKDIPEPEISFPPSTPEFTKQLVIQAEKTRLVKTKLGPSPKDFLMQTLLFGKRTLLSSETETINLPEIRNADD